VVAHSAESLVCIVSSIKGLKEERPCKTKDRRKNDEMVGLESTSGQVPQEERRDGWVRINKWSSAKLHDLKISKYLH
jgi:hypothetical protein